MKTFNTKFKAEYEYYKIDLDNPNLRVDLKAIPLALDNGFEVIEGETFADQVQFSKDNVRVWYVLKVRAEIIDGKYCNHKQFDSYKAAFSDNN